METPRCLGGGLQGCGPQSLAGGELPPSQPSRQPAPSRERAWAVMAQPKVGRRVRTAWNARNTSHTFLQRNTSLFHLLSPAARTRNPNPTGLIWCPNCANTSMARRGAPLQPEAAVVFCSEMLQSWVCPTGALAGGTGEDATRELGGHTSHKRLLRPLGGWLKSPHPLPHSAAELRGGACCSAGEGTHLLHAKNNVEAQARRAVSLHANLGVLLSLGVYGKLGGWCFSFLGRRKGHVHLLSGRMRYNLQDHPALAGLASFVRGGNRLWQHTPHFARTAAPIPSVLHPLPWLRCKDPHQHAPSI